MKRIVIWTTMGALLGAASQLNAATTVFSSSFDDSTGFSILATADTAATFGYDYSADGIPEAPNSVGGSPTTGLKLEANIVEPASVEEIAAITTGLNLSGRYSVQADIWINANGPFPGGGAGSTEFAGVAIGHDGTTAPKNGASLIFTGEGGTTTDYRLYKNEGQQFIASGQYAITSNNNTDSELSTAFPGLEPPAIQGQTGETADGAGGFQWMTLLVEVDSNAIGSGLTSDPGIARFWLTSAASGNSLLIGTIDNSNGGTVVNMTGNAAVLYSDLFTSISDNPAFSFGVIDNLVINVPEPSTVALGCLAAVAVVGYRRFRR